MGCARSSLLWGHISSCSQGDFSLWWLPLLHSRVFRSQLSNCGSQAQLPHGMWNLPGRGTEPLFSAVVVFLCGSAGKETVCNAGDLGSIPGLGKSPGEGKGYSLQYFGLENSMDCIIHGVSKSETWVSDFHFTSLHWQADSFNHWTTREVQTWLLLIFKMYLFLTVLGLCCCLGFSLVVESRDYSVVAVPKLLIAVASLVAEYKL